MIKLGYTARAVLGAGLASALNLDDWKAFNASIDGRLQQNLPMALPCFRLYNNLPHAVDVEACARVTENYTSSAFRAEIPGVSLSPQDEVCLSSPEDQCLLDNTGATAALPAANASCNQGSLPPYVATVQQASDIAAAFAFARQHNITVSVKNSGHDYMTRNFQRDSLLLWVHQLQNKTYHRTFVPAGCEPTFSNTYGPVLTIGTGTSSDAATIFATTHNTTLLVGSSPTVAVSGGWVLGAGHSILSPAFGLGVDRVVQFTLVTADGELRVANACQNKDLFWALRGGGGGTFGIVLDASHRVEAGLTPVAVANMTLPANLTADVAVEWLALQAREGLRWGRMGWGGHAAGRYLTHVNPMPSIANLSDGGAAAESMRAATEFVLAHGGMSVVKVLSSWSEAWETYVKPEARPVGGMSVFGQRLWPQRLFETEEGLGKIAGYVESLAEQGSDPRATYIPADFPFLVPGSSAGYDTKTSTHPSWYASLWNYGAIGTLAWNSSYADRLAAAVRVLGMNELAGQIIGPGSGAYVHETSYFTIDWRESMWGPNYERLLEVKKKYDPDMLLRCWKCVGFDESEVNEPIFKCQGKLQVEAEAALRGNNNSKA